MYISDHYTSEVMGAGEEFTSHKVTKSLTSRLKDMGKKGESYEDIIWRLIEGTGNENRVEEKEAMEKLSAQIEALTAKFKNLESTRNQKK